jgi:hypothetical protein
MELAERAKSPQEGKRKMKTLVAVTVFILFVSNAFAAEVSWMYVQHRRYENGRILNRLVFGLVDEKGHNLTDGSSVADVKLYAPNGAPVKLSKYKFASDEEIFGLYDAIRSQWFYTDTWQFDSWFRANFSEPLIPGIYRLKVTTIDGEITEGTCKFKAIVDLPFIFSRSFKFYPDLLGNIIWKWDIPDNLGHLVFNHQTEARASIDIYRNENNVAYFFVKIPSHMGYVFIPRNVVQKINSMGNQFGLKVQLETGDKNSRTYSNTLVITDMTAKIPNPDKPELKIED